MDSLALDCPALLHLASAEQKPLLWCKITVDGRGVSGGCGLIENTVHEYELSLRPPVTDEGTQRSVNAYQRVGPVDHRLAAALLTTFSTLIDLLTHLAPALAFHIPYTWRSLLSSQTPFVGRRVLLVHAYW